MLAKKYHFPLLFLVLFLALQAGYWLLPDSIAKDFLVNQLTVKPSASIINAMTDSQTQVVASGSRIVSDQARINVLRGCEGTEAMLLLLAAVLAARQPLLKTVLGIVAGIGLIFIINQIRIAALYFISVYQHGWFAPVHGYIAPLMIIGIAWLFYQWWLNLKVPQP